MSRGMMSLLAGLSGGLQGYNTGTQQRLDNERRAKIDQIALERAQREGTEFDQQQADRAELRAAGAPVAASPDMAQTPDGPMQRMVKSDTQDNRDVGQPGEQAPAPASIVAGQGGLSPDATAAALAQQNSPQAVQSRQLDVLQRQNPAVARQFMTSRTQGELAEVQLHAAKATEASKAVSLGLRKAAGQGWDALAEYMNKSGADHETGQWVPSADGKTMTAHQRAQDGSLKPVQGMTFPNTDKGRLEAAMALDSSIPLDAKLEYHQKEASAANTERHQTRMEGIAKQNADTNEEYRKDMGLAALTKADNTGKSPFDRMSEVDKTTLLDLNKQAEAINAAILKARAEGSFDEASPNGHALMTERAALRLRASALASKYAKDGDSGAPDPLGVRTPAATTKGKAGMAEILADMKASGTSEADVNIGGQPVKVSLPGAKPAAPAARAAAPAAAAGTPGAPADAAAPAPARSGGFMQRLADLGTDYTTPQGKAALKARVAESKAGGSPLTEVEALRAKQAGFI